ncbi:PREDICTED: LETM1 domain-containing protein 1-like [Amphimedon queenslandica]|uniref:Letm1 RBD domain-containing protein n=1 Tax=Amphimedon queenslandica TaxID=400682 RepID=A0A1X7V2C5_AMPQE|nr:PREDICTED: LETM1 domain-containing protein 1-like [Amphimedon queenslandica]|eukprot:XP_011403447.1 PREDICTED: LETM1 domain-containing protein 1-like [Amphimedon queenslandica]
MLRLFILSSRYSAPPFSPPTQLTCISLTRLRQTQKSFPYPPSLSLYSTLGSKQGEGYLKTRWKYIVTVVKSFVQGMKLLIKDVKEARRLRRNGLKLDGTRPRPPPESTITWEDLRFIDKTVSDLKRVFPTIALFWIPLVGYVAPFLALAFPKYLLSSHFWSADQRKEFEEKNKVMRKDNTKRLKEYLLENKNDGPVKIIADCLDKVKQQKEKDISDWNWVSESGIMSMDLSSLSSQHINCLSHSWGIKTLLPFPFWQRRRLVKRLNYIYGCDYLLQSRGINDRGRKREALMERGVSVKNVDRALDVWLSLSNSQENCPYVLLSHAPLVWVEHSNN